MSWLWNFLPGNTVNFEPISSATALGQQAKGAQGCNKLLSEYLAPQAC
jgi:hypothetical protein